MDKSKLRKEYLEKRNQLDKALIEKWSMKMAFSFFNTFETHQKLVHLFLSIKELNEIQTEVFVNRLFEDDAKVATSITHFNPKKLEHTLINKETTYTKDKYGVPVPSPIISIAEESIDIVLVPLLCIDFKGNRVGYGQGFYDGFLKKCGKNTPIIGLSLFEPIDTEIHTNDWDVPLDYCITPNEVYMF